MTVTLPKPPSGNHYYKWTSKPFPHWYITARGKAWQEEAQWLLKVAFGRRKTIETDVAIHIDFYKTRKKFDSDNLLKATFDAFTKSGVIADDSLVADHSVHREYVEHMADERLELELIEL